MCIALGCAPTGAPTLPALNQLTPNRWNELRPGGATECANGSPFAFYVWPGTSPMLVLNFLDGGGCWNTQTCRDLKWFTPDLEAASSELGPNATVKPTGLVAMTDPRNPVRSATQVVVSYCTGDIHWGDRSSVYGEPGHSATVRHRGAVNARSVLDWVFANVPAPEVVLSTGCSAGSSGAIMWGAHLMRHYPAARHVVLGDSGAGVISDNFLASTLATWNGTAAFPDWIPNFDAVHVTRMADIYERVGTTYPRAALAQCDNMKDRVQSKFYGLMVGDVNIPTATWAGLMVAGMNDIGARVPNFHPYLVDIDGATDFDTHCIINKDALFDLETSDGTRMVKIVDWLSDMLAGKPVADVRCPTCR